MISVGIEATGLLQKNHTGISVYTKELLEGLAASKKVSVSLCYKASKFKKKYRQLIPENYNTMWYYKNFLPVSHNLDISHSCDNRFLKLKNTKKVVTIHDLAIFKKEHQFKFYTDLSNINKNFKNIEKFVLESDKIIAVSQNTKQDILDFFNVSPDKIDVVYLPVRKFLKTNRKDILTKYALKEKKYFFFVGAISIRKNLLNLIKAYKKSNMFHDFDLVLAGPLSMGSHIIMEEIKNLSLEKNIKLIGYLQEDELKILYEKCRAFLFPTFYEGFGIPIIEAMSMGAPVLIGNRGAAPEIANKFAIECDPFSVDDISTGIKKVIKQKSSIIRDAKKYSETFSVDRMIHETINVYNKLLSRKI